MYRAQSIVEAIARLAPGPFQRAGESKRGLKALRSGEWPAGPGILVPHAGIEPALLSELDFESSASTSSANGARHCSHRRLHDAPAGGNRQIGVQRAITYPCGAFTMWPYLIELGAVSLALPAGFTGRTP